MQKTIRDIKVGFIISHPFHVFLYRPLIEQLDNPLLIIETRKSTPFNFSPKFFETLPCEYVKLDENQIKLADQQVDVIFVMTPKHLSAQFQKAKTIVMQYGMAKEYYNYGLWRSRGDLNMMYGPYSHDTVKGYAVSRAVGNMRLDGYSPAQTGGGGLLYIPTYGELSSLREFVKILPKLDPSVPVRIKLHHASEFADKDIIKRLADYPQVTIVSGYADAFDELSSADIVMSDYSGAIFDAVFLKRPLVLFQPGFVQTKQRTGDDSIEIAQGAEFGTVLKDEEDLVQFFDTLAQGKPYAKVDVDSDKYLSNAGNAVPVAIDLIEQLVNGDIVPNIVQRSVRGTYTDLLKRPKVRTFKQALRGRIKKWFLGK